MSTKETLPLPEFLERCAKQLAEIESLRTRLDAAEKELAKIKLRNLANAIKQICAECGHTNTEDGCAFCIKESMKGIFKCECGKAGTLLDILEHECDSRLFTKGDLQAELTKAKEANAELVKDRERVSKLANLIWQTRWVSEDSDYQDLVGIAAEIRSGNFNGIDAAITKGT